DPTDAEAHTGLGYFSACKKEIPIALRHANLAQLYGGGSYLILHNVACVYSKLSDGDPDPRGGFRQHPAGQRRPGGGPGGDRERRGGVRGDGPEGRGRGVRGVAEGGAGVREAGGAEGAVRARGPGKGFPGAPFVGPRARTRPTPPCPPPPPPATISPCAS